MSKIIDLNLHGDAHREGFAGMHDLIGVENINRTAKKNEVLAPLETIYLQVPPQYTRGRHRILLIQGPHDERAGTALFPLGLGYIARVLADIGVEVDTLDAHAEKLSPEETLAEIRKRTFDLVGITALSTQYAFVKWLAKEIKVYHPQACIIVGGQLAHYNPHTLIGNTMVDVCVIGEGEVTVQDLVYNLNDLSRVRGIAYRDESGRYRRNPDRGRITNPEVIPFPLWDAFNMDYYFTHGFFGSRAHRCVNILTSRGCPYSCTFCSLSFPNVTYRSVDNVIDEIRHLKENYGVDGIEFCDELFVISKKRVYEFCEKLKPLKIAWGGQGRANIVNDDEKLLKAMKDAGAAYIGFGLESATSDMLSRMQKKTTVEQNINCVRTAQKVGLVVVAQYMFGFPGETLESIKAGIDYFKEIHYIPPIGPNAPPHISLTVALPGAQLYEDCKQSGMITDEDEYLSKISRGYYFNEEIVVNLTSFTDQELIDLKTLAEQTMVENYMEWIRQQGLLFSLRRMFTMVWDVFRYEGVASFARKITTRALGVGKRFLMGDIGALNPWNVIYSHGRTRTDYAYRSARALDFKKKLLS